MLAFEYWHSSTISAKKQAEALADWSKSMEEHPGRVLEAIEDVLGRLVGHLVGSGGGLSSMNFIILLQGGSQGHPGRLLGTLGDVLEHPGRIMDALGDVLGRQGRASDGVCTTKGGLGNAIGPSQK